MRVSQSAAADGKVRRRRRRGDSVGTFAAGLRDGKSVYDFSVRPSYGYRSDSLRSGVRLSFNGYRTVSAAARSAFEAEPKIVRSRRPAADVSRRQIRRSAVVAGLVEKGARRRQRISAVIDELDSDSQAFRRRVAFA